MIDAIAENTRELFTKRALEAFTKVKGNRHYALDLASANQLGAYALAYRDTVLEAGGRFELSELTKLLDELAQVRWAADGKEHGLNLVQSRPGPEIALKPICDPITGLPIKNPFSYPPDLTSQMLLEKENPALAKYYRETKDGTTFAMIAKMKEEREQRDRIRAIEYGEKQHRENPFLLPHGKEALQKQSELVRANEHQPHIVNWYQAEAKAKPSLGFGNVTVRMAITKRDPQLGAIYQKAEAIYQQWLKADAQRLREQQEQNRQQIEQTERALASASAR